METSKTAAPCLVAQTCEAYQALCSFVSWALYSDPDLTTLRGFAAERQMFLEPPFSQVAPQASAELAGLLAPCEGEGEAGDEAAEAFAQEVHRDRSYLFYMVGSSHTSPYESVYRSDDMTMFGPHTLAVREAYHAAGVQFDRSATEPDDHAGLEFAFCAHLLGQAAAGDEGALAACRDFLAEHLLVFGPTYLHNLGVRAKSPFYRCVAAIAGAVLEALARDLNAQAVEELDAKFTLA